MLNSNFMLHGEALEKFVVPSLSWFQKQRETVGLHSWSCAMLAIAGAEAVLQCGHDETQIDKVSTFNQWCLTCDKEMELQLVTFEAGGVLVGGTAEKIAAHIEDSWELGAKAVMLMREELIVEGGLALADELAPLHLGGVELLKLQSTIHDTCHCANLVPSKLRKLKEKSYVKINGQEAWDAAPEQETKMHDYL